MKFKLEYILQIANLLLVLSLILVDTNTEQKLIKSWGVIAGILGICIFAIGMYHTYNESSKRSIIIRNLKKQIRYELKCYVWPFKALINEYTSVLNKHLYDRSESYRKHDNYRYGYLGTEKEKMAEPWELNPEYYFKTIYYDIEAWDFLRSDLIQLTKKTSNEWAQEFINASRTFKNNMENILLKYDRNVPEPLFDIYHELINTLEFRNFCEHLEESLKLCLKNDENIDLHNQFRWKYIGGMSEHSWQQYTDLLVKFTKETMKL